MKRVEVRMRAIEALGAMGSRPADRLIAEAKVIEGWVMDAADKDDPLPVKNRSKAADKGSAPA